MKSIRNRCDENQISIQKMFDFVITNRMNLIKRDQDWIDLSCIASV